MDFAESLALLLQRNAKTGTKTSGRRKNNSHAIKSSHFRKTAVRRNTRARADHEKKCQSQLEAHFEFRWQGYYLQGDIHTRDLIQDVLPALLRHTSWRLAQESTSSFSLCRYWKVEINLTAKSNNRGTLAASSDSVFALLFPQPFSFECSTQPCGLDTAPRLINPPQSSGAVQRIWTALCSSPSYLADLVLSPSWRRRAT